MLIRYVTLLANYKPRFSYTVRFFITVWLILGLNMTATSARNEEYVLVAFGDSLTAGYGLSSTDSFPFYLQKQLNNKGYNVKVINAGVSGDTVAGGLARLEWSIDNNVNGVIIELGANDALRGVSPASTRKSLEQILIRLKQRKIDILLTGMLAPLNLGPEYGESFNSIFSDLASKYDVVFYPFFLKDVAGKPFLNQADGLHPTAQGTRIIVQNILPKVEELLKNSSIHFRSE